MNSVMRKHVYATKAYFSSFVVHCLENKIILYVKSMQRSGTEAIRTQIQPSKPRREITNITNSQNTKRTYGQPSEPEVFWRPKM